MTFQGKAYTLTDYAFSADVASANGSRTITGTVSAFPSDLVYSVTAQSNGTSVAATLTATSLSLDRGRRGSRAAGSLRGHRALPGGGSGGAFAGGKDEEKAGALRTFEPRPLGRLTDDPVTHHDLTSNPSGG